MHIYVTGAAGKLGSALLRRLLEINFALELEVDARDGGVLAPRKGAAGGANINLAASDLQWLTGSGTSTQQRDPGSTLRFVTVTAVDIVPLSAELARLMAASNAQVERLWQQTPSHSKDVETPPRSRFELLDLAGSTTDGWQAVERSMMGAEQDLERVTVGEEEDGCGWRRKDGQGTECDAVIHFGAVPNPINIDARTVQAVNAVGAYNVLFTAARLGIRRIVQASSVNAPGLGYGADRARAQGRRWERLPLTEDAVAEPDDAYALSKYICEIQADSVERMFRDAPRPRSSSNDQLRITTLRFHFTDTRRSVALQRSTRRELWAYTSMRSACDAALLGIRPGPSSTGWAAGHEVFNIVGPHVVFGRESAEWVAESKESSALPNDLPSTGGWRGARHGAGTLDVDIPTGDARPGLYHALATSGFDADAGDVRQLFQAAYPEWQGEFDSDWWEHDGRRSFYDATKAERLLGWKHVDQEQRE